MVLVHRVVAVILIFAALPCMAAVSNEKLANRFESAFKPLPKKLDEITYLKDISYDRSSNAIELIYLLKNDAFEMVKADVKAKLISSGQYDPAGWARVEAMFSDPEAIFRYTVSQKSKLTMSQLCAGNGGLMDELLDRSVGFKFTWRFASYVESARLTAEQCRAFR